jgi:hypothetical protein
MFLGLPDRDPDPLVRGTDPDPDRLRILLFSQKCVERTEIMPEDKIFTQILAKNFIFKTEDDVPLGKLKKKI